MRDPTRIHRIVNLLYLFWMANPDLRLGQIVVNATGVTAPFNVEDDVVERVLSVALEGRTVQICNLPETLAK